jgi:hypothetical protein
MPAPQDVDGGVITDTGDLEAALRALHLAAIHLETATAGSSGGALVNRSSALVHEALGLLAAATRAQRRA